MSFQTHFWMTIEAIGLWSPIASFSLIRLNASKIKVFSDSENQKLAQKIE